PQEPGRERREHVSRQDFNQQEPDREGRWVRRQHRCDRPAGRHGSGRSGAPPGRRRGLILWPPPSNPSAPTPRSRSRPGNSSSRRSRVTPSCSSASSSASSSSAGGNRSANSRSKRPPDSGGPKHGARKPKG